MFLSASCLLIRASEVATDTVRQGLKGRGTIVVTLRLLERSASVEQHHDGEVYDCAYTPDGSLILTVGWDGMLRVWDAATGELRVVLPASPKPLSSCASAPNGHQWLTGSMEGLLGLWDGVSQQQLYSFVAHTRPISAICYSPDGQLLATASWDRQVIVRKVGKEQEGRSLLGHQDIVAGCCFTVDSKRLVSWSHDATIRIWDLSVCREVTCFTGHTERVICVSPSADGRYVISGSRDTTLRLWDLDSLQEVATVNIGVEIRLCLFLLDAESVVVADAAGRLFLMTVPDFQVLAQLQMPFKVMCGKLSPSGLQLALGTEEGQIHLLAIDGQENAYLVVNPTRSLKERTTILGRFFGTSQMQPIFHYQCPVCRHPIESDTLPTAPVACPCCHRWLRVNNRLALLQPT
jgi:WD40 repeat protein